MSVSGGFRIGHGGIERARPPTRAWAGPWYRGRQKNLPNRFGSQKICGNQTLFWLGFKKSQIKKFSRFSLNFLHPIWLDFLQPIFTVFGLQNFSAKPVEMSLTCKFFKPNLRKIFGLFILSAQPIKCFWLSSSLNQTGTKFWFLNCNKLNPNFWSVLFTGRTAI